MVQTGFYTKLVNERHIVLLKCNIVTPGSSYFIIEIPSFGRTQDMLA